MVREIEPLLRGKTFTAAISGSAGMGLAEAAGIPFVQEVYATGETVRALEPDAGTVIELGGEDAKVIFFKGGVDERMNGSCAGGTGAFIDQMATLLDMHVAEMDRLSLAADAASIPSPRAAACSPRPTYSRCSIRARSSRTWRPASTRPWSIRPSPAWSQGRTIEGKVLFLGGPLHYCQGLRQPLCRNAEAHRRRGRLPGIRPLLPWPSARRSTRARRRARLPMSRSPARWKSRCTPSRHAGTLPPLFKSDADYRAFAAAPCPRQRARGGHRVLQRARPIWA